MWQKVWDAINITPVWIGVGSAIIIGGFYIWLKVECFIQYNARLAHLDRALGYELRGSRFDPYIVHHFY